MKKSKVNIIAHTHWDAEWYFTKSDTDVLLVNNIKDTVKKLNNVNYPFYWDGQSYPIQKYLQIHEDQNLVNMVKQNKLIIGPWYTQSKARQVLGENYYRNLEHGINVSKKIGKSSYHALMSDIFGFSDQVPQVLAKNGIKSTIFMRGWNPKSTNGINEFRWCAPSGSSVFVKVPQEGYGNAKFLGENNKVENKFIEIKNKDLYHTFSKVSLLLNGGDQMYFRDNLDKAIDYIEKKDDSEWTISSIEEYVSSVKKSLKNKQMPIYQGEIATPIGQRIHLSSYSQRQDINELIGNLEYKIVYGVEPLNLMYEESTGKNFSNLIYKAWEKLFLSVSHDAAAGCNSDETNRGILARLEEANQSIDSIINLIQRDLTFSIKDNLLRVFNTSFSKKTIYIDTKISTLKKNFILKDSKNRKINFIIKKSSKFSEGKKIEVSTLGEKEIELGRYYLHSVRLEVKNADPLSFIDIEIIEKQNNESNRFKKLLKEFKNLKIRFEANDGDSYDFSPDRNEYFEDHKLRLDKTFAISQNGFSYFKKEVKLSLWSDFLVRKSKVKQSFTVECLINPDGRKDYNLLIDNKIKNCRLSLLFILKNEIKKAISNNMFFEKEFKNKQIPNNWKEIYREKPVNLFPFVGFFKAKSINFASRTLREFQFNKKELMITLMRSNGMLGKDNLKWRPGRASGVNDIQIETHDAQMIKKIEVLFSLLPKYSRKDFEEYLVDIISYQSNQRAKHIARMQRFFLPNTKFKNINLNLEIPKELEVKAFYIWANKKYVRLLNTSNQKIEIAKIKVKNIEREFAFEPWEIQTIHF